MIRREVVLPNGSSVFDYFECNDFVGCVLAQKIPSQNSLYLAINSSKIVMLSVGVFGVYPDLIESIEIVRHYNKVLYDGLQRNQLEKYSISLNIPGVGVVTNDSCGCIKYVDRCPVDGYIKKGFYSCHNYECPVCYKSAAHQAGLRVEDRLSGVSKELRRFGVKTGYPVHVIFSPREGVFTPSDGIPEMRRVVYDLARVVGMIGGVVVFHPYRILPGIKAELVSHNLKGDPMKYWDLVRLDVLGLGSWKNYVYWSPHFHVVGYFPEVKMKSDEFQRLHDWSYKNIGVTDSICATVTYILTHHAHKKGYTGYTYFGHFSYSCAKIVKTLYDEEPVLCPHCCAHLDRWDKFEVLDNGFIDLSRAECLGPAYQKKKVNLYKLTRWLIKDICSY
jgi:hypothetical protein